MNIQNSESESDYRNSKPDVQDDNEVPDKNASDRLVDEANSPDNIPLQEN